MEHTTQLLVFTPQNDATLVHLRRDLSLAWLDIARIMHRGLELVMARGAQLGLGPDYVNDRTWTSHEDKILDNTLRLNPHVPQNVLFGCISSTLLWDRSTEACAHRWRVCDHLGGWNSATAAAAGHDLPLGSVASLGQLEENWERGLMLGEHLGRAYRLSKEACERRLAMLTSAPLGPRETLVFPVPYQAPAGRVSPPLTMGGPRVVGVGGWLGGGPVMGNEATTAARCEHLLRLGLVLEDIALVLGRPAWSIANHLQQRGFHLDPPVGGENRRSDWTLAQDMMLDLNRAEGHTWFAISDVFYRGRLSPLRPLHRQLIDCVLRYENAGHLGLWNRENDGLLENVRWANFEHEWETWLRDKMRPRRCTKRACEMRLLMLGFASVPFSALL